MGDITTSSVHASYKKYAVGFTLICIILFAAWGTYVAYLHLYVLRDAPKYPSGVMENIVVYRIDPETIPANIDKMDFTIFLPISQNPIYDDVPLLWPAGTFAWGQEDYLRVANVLHQFTWGESLNTWNLYSADFSILQCKDISRIDHASIGYYQRRGNWYYLIHNMTIDLEYGFVYAGNDDGYYRSKWSDINLDKVSVRTANDALLIVEQNGGKEARQLIENDQECNVNIYLAPFVINQVDWGWRIVYKRGTNFVFGAIVDPYTGEYKILNLDQ